VAPSRHDLRATTWARLETTMQKQVLPRFGDARLRAITNSGVQQWVSDDQRSLGRNDPEGSLRTPPVFNAAIADNRLQFNPRSQFRSGRSTRCGTCRQQSRPSQRAGSPVATGRSRASAAMSRRCRLGPCHARSSQVDDVGAVDFWRAVAGEVEQDNVTARLTRSP
jgi:Phage integrase, N-terminal SAM-like domain